jgi:hypothetical protein
VNAEKPRKGAFVVTVVAGDVPRGEPVLSLLDMARPFAKLKALDMDELFDAVKKRLAD